LRGGGATEEAAFQAAVSELDDVYLMRAELARNQRMPRHESVPVGDCGR